MEPQLIKNTKSYSDIDLMYLGPRCDYHPERRRTPTGFTWAELEAYRMESAQYQASHKFIEGDNLENLQKALKKQAKRRLTDLNYEENYLRLIQFPMPINDPSIKTTYTFSIVCSNPIPEIYESI